MAWCLNESCAPATSSPNVRSTRRHRTSIFARVQYLCMQARLIPFYASSFRCRYGALVAGQIRYPAVRAAIRSDNAALGLMVPLFLPLRIVLLRPHYQHAPSFSWFPPPSRFLLDRVPVGSESCTPSLHFFYTFRHRWSTPTPRDFTYASIGGEGEGGSIMPCQGNGYAEMPSCWRGFKVSPASHFGNVRSFYGFSLLSCFFFFVFHSSSLWGLSRVRSCLPLVENIQDTS